MQSLAVTGISGPLGQRLLPLLDRAGAGHIVGIDSRPSQVRTNTLELVTADVATADLKPLLEGVDTVIHLAWTLRPHRDPAVMARVNLDATRRVLDAAASVGATRVVHVSSATVYGAWRHNPVPITEQAPLRPNPGFHAAVHYAEAERLVAEFAAEHPSATVAVLRPVTVLGPGVDGWFTRALGGGAPVRVGASDPPRQFLHLDDLAAAVALAASAPLEGTFNVAPDGWIVGEAVRALVAGRPPLPLPARLAPQFATLAWSAHLTEAPPSLLPLVEHPWVVANDRLRAAGWQPVYSNEEALVAGRPGSRWREMSPRRRQEVALGAAGMTLAAAAGGVVALVARARRRRPVAGA